MFANKCNPIWGRSRLCLAAPAPASITVARRLLLRLRIPSNRVNVTYWFKGRQQNEHYFRVLETGHRSNSNIAGILRRTVTNALVSSVQLFRNVTKDGRRSMRAYKMAHRQMKCWILDLCRNTIMKVLQHSVWARKADLSLCVKLHLAETWRSEITTVCLL